MIVQDQIPSDTCLVSADDTVLRNALGTYDVALDRAYPYFLYPLLRYRSTDPTDTAPIDLRAFSVSIEPPVEMTLDWSDGCPARFEVPFPLTVEPGGGAAAAVEVLRPCHGDRLRQLFTAGRLPTSFNERAIVRLIVRAVGRRGAEPITSPPFEFPVRVCYGCLQTGYASKDYADFAFPRVPACAALTANPYPGNPCNPAQDTGPILCCALDAAGTQLQCPALRP
jgi:hypothetical protein